MSSTADNKRYAKRRRAGEFDLPTDAQCHYCLNPATTRDHVVPHSLIRQAKFPTGAHLRSATSDPPPVNIVPACVRCNGSKSSYRSDCVCELCLTAWKTYQPRDAIGEPLAWPAVRPVQALALLEDGSGVIDLPTALERIRVFRGWPVPLTSTIAERVVSTKTL